MTDQEHTHLAELMQDYLIERNLVRATFEDKPTAELEHMVATLSRKETRETAGLYSTLVVSLASLLIPGIIGTIFPSAKEYTDAFIVYSALPVALGLALVVNIVGNGITTTRRQRYVAQDLLEEKKAYL